MTSVSEVPDKRMTPDEVVARLRSGMTIGIGGWGSRRKPMALSPQSWLSWEAIQ